MSGSSAGRSRDERSRIVPAQPEPPTTALRRAPADGRATGDPLTAAHLVAVRYCRARIGRRGGSFADADRLARRAYLAAVASLRRCRDRSAPFLAMIYGHASTVVDQDGPPCGGGGRAAVADRMAVLVARLPARERETLVLRAGVGLSTAQTARALGWRTRVVSDVEQQALTRLRTLLPAC